MKNYIRVLGQIFGRPWAITQDGLQTVISAADRRGDIEAVLAKRGDQLEKTRHVEMITNADGGSVAVIPVTGPIFRHANLFTEISGATSIEILAQDFRTALESSDVSAIILNIDSPGGQVTGVNEMAQMIFDAREIKPVIAYVGGLGASAAYWLASGASEIVIDPTAQLGSIGVVIGFRKNNDKENETIEIVSTASPNKRPDPDTDKGRAQILEMADALAEVFISTVARNRGVDERTVEKDFGRGGLLVGEAAVKAGLADRLGSLEEIITVAAASKPANMDQSATISHKSIIGGSTEMEITVDMIKEKHPEIAEHFRLEGCKEGTSAELERIKGVQALSIAGHEKLMEELAYDGKTSPEAAALRIMTVEAEKRKQIAADTKSDADEIPIIDSGTGDDAGEEAEVKAAVAGIVAGTE